MTTILECPICADDMSVAVSATMERALGLTCCGQMVCQNCLYRHLESIFEEGLTGQGRSKLHCPLGCGHELTDKTVRATICRADRSQWFWKLVGLFFFHFVRFFTVDTFHTSLYHRVWYYWSHSRHVKADLERYEQWSLTVALRKQPTMQCPAPGCDYRWITNPLYRKHKQAHEQKTTYLWYKPPKPDKTMGQFNWVDPGFLSMDQTGVFVEPETVDGRRMVCGKCLTTFCGLCRGPWEVGSKCHHGKSCAKFSRHIPDRDYAFVAQLADTRSCPGCTLRTERTEGCNHMTCPCGVEWCYVCECSWHPGHYRCVERPHRRRSNGCTIS